MRPRVAVSGRARSSGSERERARVSKSAALGVLGEVEVFAGCKGW